MGGFPALKVGSKNGGQLSTVIESLGEGIKLTESILRTAKHKWELGGSVLCMLSLGRSILFSSEYLLLTVSVPVRSLPNHFLFFSSYSDPPRRQKTGEQLGNVVCRDHSGSLPISIIQSGIVS